MMVKTADLCDFVELLLFCLSMASFEEFRLLLVLYYDANLISNEDFLLLYEMFLLKNPNFPYDE